MKSHPFEILFAGSPAQAKLLDGSTVEVFVRELPDRYLGFILEHCENRSLLIELCTYTQSAPDAVAVIPAFPMVTAPTGYTSVPAGFADNLSDGSIQRLADLAEKLNFSRAVKKGEALLTAKKRIEPLYRQTIEQALPMFEQIMRKMLSTGSNSTPNTPPSRGARGRKR